MAARMKRQPPARPGKIQSAKKYGKFDAGAFCAATCTCLLPDCDLCNSAFLAERGIFTTYVPKVLPQHASKHSTSRESHAA